ncbi:hypothetical protein EYF80_021019 [Liparis tanakae]|uniref:Uncharacterized protein n=1 Tax=Liparis tanakae TaxID=230148 RepID=A0A4Z2HSM0_9TELE|nr:hypothetical protein EYF80_021019 [Liparis tanakae]
MCRSLILEDKLPNHMVLSPEVPGVPCLRKCLDDPDEEKQAKQLSSDGYRLKAIVYRLRLSSDGYRLKAIVYRLRNSLYPWGHVKTLQGAPPMRLQPLFYTTIRVWTPRGKYQHLYPWL